VGMCCLCWQLRSGMYGGGRGNNNNRFTDNYSNNQYESTRNTQNYQTRNQPYETATRQTQNQNYQTKPVEVQREYVTKPAEVHHYPNEPRPPSYKPEDLRNSNRVRPIDDFNKTPRDVHIRTATPNQFRDQLFW